jgi:uncharacterized protein (TIGR04255 family)
MGQKLSNAPIYYALAQVRFSALALLDQYVPAIQDKLRKVGYPDFQTALVATIPLNAIGGGPGNVPPSLMPQARYAFLNEEKTSGFIMDQSMIFFQTTAYDTFDAFVAETLRGITLLHEATEFSFSERVGIRMLDAVCPIEGEELSAYLVPGVLGLSDNLKPRELLFSVSETRTKLAESTLISRTTIFKQSKEGVSFPVELQPINLEVADKFKSVKDLYAVIDTDCWTEKREKFSVETLDKRLRLLYLDLRRSFDSTVTSHAMDVWK